MGSSRYDYEKFYSNRAGDFKFASTVTVDSAGEFVERKR